MYIYPAIDLYEGKAVRLFKGDYAQMTVYNENPAEVAKAFAAAGSKHIHLVDLEGAKKGSPANLDTIRKIREAADLFVEVGGGIRDLETIESCDPGYGGCHQSGISGNGFGKVRRENRRGC